MMLLSDVGWGLQFPGFVVELALSRSQLRCCVVATDGTRRPLWHLGPATTAGPSYWHPTVAGLS